MDSDGHASSTTSRNWVSHSRNRRHGRSPRHGGASRGRSGSDIGGIHHCIECSESTGGSQLGEGLADRRLHGRFRIVDVDHISFAFVDGDHIQVTDIVNSRVRPRFGTDVEQEVVAHRSSDAGRRQTSLGQAPRSPRAAVTGQQPQPSARFEVLGTPDKGRDELTPRVR